MGNLTDDITRLVGEIGDLHRGRGELMKDLTRGAKEMENSVFVLRTGFVKNHTVMGRRLKADLKTFNRTLKNNVNKMGVRFQKAHAKMARETKAERQAFVTGLSERIADLRQKFATDLSGAHRAWNGKGA